MFVSPQHLLDALFAHMEEAKQSSISKIVNNETSYKEVIEHRGRIAALNDLLRWPDLQKQLAKTRGN